MGGRSPAIVVGQWRGLIAFVLITGALLIKLRTEERLMEETFRDGYDHYCRDVPALIPHIFRAG